MRTGSILLTQWVGDLALPWAVVQVSPKKKKKNTCTPMFIEALFTIAKTWKQPKCPSTEEWVKLWYIYILWNIINMNEIMPFIATWMDLELILLSVVRQRKTNIRWDYYYVVFNKNDTKEFTKQKQTQRFQNQTSLQGETLREWMDWELGGVI